MTSLEVIVHSNKSYRALHVKLLSLSVNRSAVVAIATAFVITRLMVFATVFLSMATFPVRHSKGFLFASSSNLLLDGLIRFDSWWYRDIVVNGYRQGSVATGEQGTVAFFPLYPLIVNAVSQIVGNVFVSGVLVSNVCLLIALIYLYRWADYAYDSQVASRLVFYIAAAPAAIFFSAMYTESLFIALIAATFYYAQAGNWWKAAIAGALVSATRNTGVLVAAVIALEGMSREGVRFWAGTWRPDLIIRHWISQVRLIVRAWPAIVAAAFVPIGLVAYMFYLSNTFGDPIAFIHAQATWGRETGGAGIFKVVESTRTQLRLGDNFMAGQVNTVTLLDTLATLAFLPLVIVTAFKLRPAYSVYALASFFIPLSTGSVGSMSRYVLMLIPCFLLLAIWGKRLWVDRAVVASFLPLLAYFAVAFSHWYFAG